MIKGTVSIDLTTEKDTTASVSFEVDPSNFSGDEDDITQTLNASCPKITPIFEIPAKRYNYLKKYSVDVAN